MEYIILESWDLNDLVKEVNAKLNTGWQLVGGVSVTHSIFQEYDYGTPSPQLCTGYLQAMTKER